MRLSYTVILLAVLLTSCAGAEGDNTTSATNTSTTNTSNPASNTNPANEASKTSNTSATSLPDFPWPPDASAFATIPSGLLVKPGAAAKLGDVDDRLRAALRQSGYEQVGYYHIPGGYVLVTQLEQFDVTTGVPLSGEARWSTKVIPPKTSFSREYFRSLIKGTVGHFRVIAFAVSNEPFNETGKEIVPSQASKLVIAGSNVLPSNIREQSYDDSYQCTALVYEFLQPNSGQAVFVRNSGLLMSQHIQGILSSLEQSR